MRPPNDPLRTHPIPEGVVGAVLHGGNVELVADGQRERAGGVGQFELDREVSIQLILNNVVVGGG